MLRENGFRYRGNITISSEPGHDPERLCFEKILKKPGQETGSIPGIVPKRKEEPEKERES